MILASTWHALARHGAVRLAKASLGMARHGMARFKARGFRLTGLFYHMKTTLSIEGDIKTKHEKIQAEIVVPDNWKPSFNEFCKVKGALRYIEEKLSQNFTPPSAIN
jgi:hypothetical protein